MGLTELMATAVALGMDAFAVAAAIAATLPRVSYRQAFRLSWHFGLFQAMMPVLGWLAGSRLAGLLSALDHWAACGLLWLLGVRMIVQSRSAGDAMPGAADPTRGWSLVALAVATSIDALAVGVSLGLMEVRIWLPSAVIGVVALLMTLVGISLGQRVGTRVRRWAGICGGGVLLVIGARILVSHMLDQGA